MRSATLVAVLLLAPALAWGLAGAQQPFGTDAVNDVKVRGGFTGQSAPFDNADTAPVDLVGLLVTETSDAIGIGIAVRGLQSTLGPARYEVTWAFRDVQFILTVSPPFVSSDAMHVATLARVIEEENSFEFDTVARLDVVTDLATSTLSVLIPKVYLEDTDGKTPLRGDLLSDFAVEANKEVVFSSFILSFNDRLPDAGDAGRYNLSEGGDSNGHLLLVSDDPYRISNGGSHTYVLTARVESEAPFEDEVEYVVENLPEGWEVTVPKRQVVPAMGETLLTVLVSLPFAHEHGGVSDFNLTAKSTARSGIFSTMRMGILHTPVPQPTGHHDTLYFHANDTSSSASNVRLGSGARPTVSTVEDHSLDVAEMAPTGASGGDEGQTFVWTARLDPGLALGIDMDLDRLGEATLAFTSRLAGEARAGLEVYLRTEDDLILLAEGVSDAQPVSSNAKATFVVPVEPTPDADYIPYVKGRNLELRVTYVHSLTTFLCCDPQFSPTLVLADSKAQLPLAEYRDVVTTVEGQGARLGLDASGPLEKKASPGATIVYEFNVTNRGADDTFVIDVAGTDADQGIPVPRESFKLAQGETRKATLGVVVPYESSADEVIEVILLVRSQTDPANMAIARTYTTVALGGDATPDETGRLLQAQSEGADTPGVGVLAALAALGLVALATRRR